MLLDSLRSLSRQIYLRVGKPDFVYLDEPHEHRGHPGLPTGGDDSAHRAARSVDLVGSPRVRRRRAAPGTGGVDHPPTLRAEPVSAASAIHGRFREAFLAPIECEIAAHNARTQDGYEDPDVAIDGQAAALDRFRSRDTDTRSAPPAADVEDGVDG